MLLDDCFPMADDIVSVLQVTFAHFILMQCLQIMPSNLGVTLLQYFSSLVAFHIFCIFLLSEEKWEDSMFFLSQFKKFYRLQTMKGGTGKKELSKI